MEFTDLEGIRSAFAQYLEEVQRMTPEQAEYRALDFPAPYADPFLREAYLGSEEIEGERWEKYATMTDFSAMSGGPALPAFRFYTFYRHADLGNGTVGAYMKARRLFEPVPLRQYNRDFTA